MTIKPPPPPPSSSSAPAGTAAPPPSQLPPLTASTSAATAASSARRQPVRQTRTARKPAASKLTNGAESSAHHHPPAKFYPALTAFTDAVDALPSEIIRHFTLLREVDAKACLPEANLRTLIDATQRLSAPEDPYEFDAAMEALKQIDELRRRRDADPLFVTTAPQAPLLAELEKLEATETANPSSQIVLGAPETRRARCHQIRAQIADLLVTQDEKIHVITTAVDALQKHLARVDHAFAYAEVEVPPIYRLGNPEHWAYKEPMKKGTAAQVARERERERREHDERLHQLNLERESNIRGAGRAHSSTKNSHHHFAHHQLQEEHETIKKRVRKTGDNETLSSAKRIADQQAGAQQQQQSKKRKTAASKDDKEKTTATKGAASPRVGAPAPKKVKSSAQRAPRSRTAQTPTGIASATNSPLMSVGPPSIPFSYIQSMTSNGNTALGNNNVAVASPLHASRPPPASPVPAPTAISAATPTQTTSSNHHPHTPSTSTPSHSKSHARREHPKPPHEPEDMGLAPAPPPPPPEPIVAPKPSHKKKQRVTTPPTVPSQEAEDAPKKTPVAPPRKEKDRERERDKEKEGSKEKFKDKDKDSHSHSHSNSHSRSQSHSHSNAHAHPQPPASFSKSKPPPSTTAAATSTTDAKSTASNPAATPGSRSRKRADSSVTSAAPAKKSHKAKSQQKPLAHTGPIGLGISTFPRKDKEAGTGEEEEADGEEEEGEETYCYCNQISYGEMVACDGEDCEREWFHLDCAGLQAAPKGKVKWFCNDCSKAPTRRGASRA